MHLPRWPEKRYRPRLLGTRKGGSWWNSSSCPCSNMCEIFWLEWCRNFCERYHELRMVARCASYDTSCGHMAQWRNDWWFRWSSMTITGLLWLYWLHHLFASAHCPYLLTLGQQRAAMRLTAFSFWIWHICHRVLRVRYSSTACIASDDEPQPHKPPIPKVIERIIYWIITPHWRKTHVCHHGKLKDENHICHDVNLQLKTLNDSIMFKNIVPRPKSLIL